MIKSKGEKAFDISLYVILSIMMVVFVLPYLLILSASVTDELSFLQNGFALIPKKFSFEAYKYIFNPRFFIWTGFKNSIIITLMGTVTNVAITAMFAYPMSRLHLKGRNILLKLVLFTMLFHGGLIPYYLLVTGLGLKNSYWAIIVNGMMHPWHMLIMRSYFLSLGAELEEAAEIDGASHFRIFFKIYLPIAVPCLATIVLFTAVSYWSTWSTPQLFFDAQHRHMMPLMVFLREMIQNVSAMGSQSSAIVPSEVIKMATVAVTTIPIIALYPFLQKYFINGVMIGSIKG